MVEPPPYFLFYLSPSGTALDGKRSRQRVPFTLPFFLDHILKFYFVFVLKKFSCSSCSLIFLVLREEEDDEFIFAEDIVLAYLNIFLVRLFEV